MNKKEIAEIRRRFTMDANAVSCIRGCYVNGKGEVISEFRQSLIGLPQEEAEKYLAIFKRVLSGTQGQNLTEISFTPGQVMVGEEHALLTQLRETALLDDDVADKYCRRVIDSLQMEENYLILLAHDAYDVFSRPRDEDADAPSEEVFSYIVCAVCPVKQTKPALSYHPAENEFHARELEWIVNAPEIGFLFPEFDDRSANIYGALYYTRATDDSHAEFVTGVFGGETPVPAAEQKEAFQEVLSESLERELSLDVVAAVDEGLRELIEERKSEGEAEPATVGKREVRKMLAECGVPAERMEAFEQKFDERFGATAEVNAANLIAPKQTELRTPDVVIRVSPEHAGLIETRIIDGCKYILIRADEGVEVNGVNIHIND